MKNAVVTKRSPVSRKAAKTHRTDLLLAALRQGIKRTYVNDSTAVRETVWKYRTHALGCRRTRDLSVEFRDARNAGRLVPRSRAKFVG